MAGYSPVAAGGIVTFHPSPIAVMLQGNDRLCDSLILLIQESSPIAFAIESTRSYDVPLTRDPLHSAVWTFLPAKQGENADSNVRPYYTTKTPTFAGVFRQVISLQKNQPPILYIPVPQTGHLPFIAGLPFFMVTLTALGSSRLARHLTQYMLAIVFCSPPLHK